MSNKSTAGLLIALIALLSVFYYVTNLGAPKPPPPPRRITSLQVWKDAVDVACKPERGNPAATWTVVEIGDFQCPICGRSRKYVETMIDKSDGHAKLYFINFPLQMHEFAVPAAVTALAAEKQGKFWAMYDQLYSHQESLNPAGLRTCVGAVGMDITAYKKAVRSSAILTTLSDQRNIANEIGVQATPTFLVHQDGSKTFKMYVGMWPQSETGNSPGLRELMMDTPWGVKLNPSDIPPPKNPAN